MIINRYFSHKDEGQAFRVTKSPMSMTFLATLSAVKVAKQKNTNETAWVRTRGERSLRMERRAWNRRCEKRKYFGMN